MLVLLTKGLETLIVNIPFLILLTMEILLLGDIGALEKLKGKDAEIGAALLLAAFMTYWLESGSGNKKEVR